MGFDTTRIQGAPRDVSVPSGDDHVSSKPQGDVTVPAAYVPQAGQGAAVYSLADRRDAYAHSPSTSPIARLFGTKAPTDLVGHAKATAACDAFMAMLFPRNGQSGPQGSESV